MAEAWEEVREEVAREEEEVAEGMAMGRVGVVKAGALEVAVQVEVREEELKVVVITEEAMKAAEAGAEVMAAKKEAGAEATEVGWKGVDIEEALEVGKEGEREVGEVKADLGISERQTPAPP